MWQGNQGGYTEDYDSSRKIRPFVIIISIWCFGCVRVFGILGVCIWYFGVCIWYLGVCIWYLVLCVCVRGGGGSLFFRYVKVMQWNSIKLKEWNFVKIYFWWKQYFSSLRHRFFWSHLEIVDYWGEMVFWLYDTKKWKGWNHCNQLLQRYNCWWRGEDINAIPYDLLLLAQILKTRYPGPSLCWDFWSGQLWDSNDEQGNDREPIGGRRLWISHVFATITQLLGQLVENILQIQKKSYSYGLHHFTWLCSLHTAWKPGVA